MAQGIPIGDESCVTMPIRYALNLQKHGIQPPNIYDMVYRDAVLTIIAISILKGDDPDPRSSEQTEDTDVTDDT